MDNIWDVFKTMEFITDTVRNGACSPEESAMALDSGQLLFFKECVEKKDREALYPFEKKSVLATSASGFLQYPIDFSHRIMPYIGDQPLEGLTENTIGERLNSVIYPPDASRPIFILIENGLQLYPKQSYSINLQYVSIPATPIINYTVSGNTIVFNPTGSIELGFTKEYWVQILLMSLPFVGVSLSDKDVFSLIALSGQNDNKG